MKTTDIVLSAVRSIGASFPGTSSLVNAWNEYSTNSQIERCTRLIQSLAAELEQIRATIRPSVEECAEVFQLGLHCAMHDPYAEKATTYAALIVAYCDSTIDKDAVLNLIYECETLLPYDIETLRRLKGNRRVDSAFSFDERSDRNAVGKRQTSLKKLEGKGLIGVGGEGPASFERIYENSTAWPFTFYQQYYLVLPQGQALLRILDRPTAQPVDGERRS